MIPARRLIESVLVGARDFLERALRPVPDHRWAERPSDAYSPIGWHAGHVAAIQARFLLGDARHAFFDPFQTPKEKRADLPPPREVRRFLAETLERVCSLREPPRHPGLPADFLPRHVAQHELHHAEHIQVIAALLDGRLHRMPPPLLLPAAQLPGGAPGADASRLPVIEHPGGSALIGSADASEAADNEGPRHQRSLEPFWIDRAPVTAAAFRAFVAATGFREGPDRLDEQNPQAPVTCVSWFDADAYARWRGARLPTEEEYEAAAPEPAGVWEWTSSWFAPYPGFRPFPYDGYSTPWFGESHRVLRGASWATAPRLRRRTMRNWYEPGFRQIPSGFRCAGRR